MKETWKPIPMTKGKYALSNKLRIKHVRLNRLVDIRDTKDGYRLATIWVSKKGKFTQKTMQQIVADVFLGPCPKGKEVNHKNGIKDDYSSDNLEYVTHDRNMEHAGENGLMKYGEKHFNAKLKNEDIPKIFKLRLKGRSFISIGKKFGVDETSIRDVLYRRKWEHVYISRKKIKAVRAMKRKSPSF